MYMCKYTLFVLRIHAALATSTANLLCAINYSNLFTFFPPLIFIVVNVLLLFFVKNTHTQTYIYVHICMCRYFCVGSMPNGSQIHFECSNKFSLKSAAATAEK